MSKRVVRLIRQASGEVLLDQVTWCASFGCKFKGLMLRPSIDPSEGLLMVEKRASRAGAGIHMLFMRFPIAVVWLDADLTVVEKLHAQPWRLAYVPREPAQYILEAHPALLERVQVGDALHVDDAA